jgi:hypothetical protein
MLMALFLSLCASGFRLEVLVVVAFSIAGAPQAEYWRISASSDYHMSSRNGRYAALPTITVGDKLALFLLLKS